MGYADVYHQYDPPGWTGPTGFYRLDYRAQLAPDETKTWAPIYLWADPDAYGLEYMTLAMETDPSVMPPADRRYTVELLFVPPGVQGAPPVGTVWTLELNKTLKIDVPTFATYNGLEGYQFAFTTAPVPEPAALPLFVVGLLGLRRR